MKRKTATIPVDLHMEILKFLPSKWLMKFRCVSKTWNCNILNPIFAKLHRTISQTRPGATAIILLSNSPSWCLSICKINHLGEAIHELTMDISKFRPDVCGMTGISITQVVNGLVCFCIGLTGEVFVCNITTHEIISLPTQSDINGSDQLYFLGYDPLNDEYKVLCTNLGRKSCRYTIFTIMKDIEWRDVNVIDPLVINLQCSGFLDILHDGLYHDGSIYCLSQINQEEKHKLVAFDVREEKFRTIGIPDVRVQPEPLSELSAAVKLVQIEDRIAVCASTCGSNLFVLEDFHNQVWVQRNIQIPMFLCHIGSMKNKLIFLDWAQRKFAFDPNNGEVSWFVISGPGHVIKEPTTYRVFPTSIYICEIVENIYPLKQN